MKDIKGNFEDALNNMLIRLTLNEYSKGEVLAYWNSERGDDWFTGTINNSSNNLVLKGSKLCKAMLERGDAYIMCFVSNENETTAEFHRNTKCVQRLVTMISAEPEFYVGHDSNGEPERWKYAVPIDSKGKILTQKEVGL